MITLRITALKIKQKPYFNLLLVYQLRATTCFSKTFRLQKLALLSAKVAHNTQRGNDNPSLNNHHRTKGPKQLYLVLLDRRACHYGASI